MARQTLRLAGVAAIGLAVLFAAQPVAAQDSGNLARQVERLRRELADLQRYVYKGGQPPAPAVTGGDQPVSPEVAGRMQVQITQMQEQMRDLNGRLEEVQHRIRVLEDRLNRMSEDLEVRLLAIEDALAQGAAAAPRAVPEGEAAAPGNGGASVAAAPSAGPIQLPEGSAREQYDFAYNLLKNHQWAEGRSALLAFLEKHPDNDLADNAAYWVGETYYINKQYKDAAKSFLEGYRKYPKADKAPDNLLKLAKSLAALDQVDNACTTYAKLLEDYPNSLPRIIKLAKSERKKLKCK
jgi:tol-pal system protein YbgF